MSGILDNKSRIIDVIITSEGRRQIASGDLRIRYATFTDVGSFYEAESLSGSSDATSRIYLEAASLPQDQITFESDDSGKLKPFSSDSDLSLHAGQLISYSYTASTSSLITGSNQVITVLKGSEFSSTMEGVFTGSIDNFSKLQIIGSHDPALEDDGFAVGPSKVGFMITDDKPLDSHIARTCNINDAESLFSDPRLANVRNFKFLPPINVQPRSSENKNKSKDKIGDYAPWGGVSHAFNRDKAYNILRDELQHFEKLGYCKTISFDPTSKENKLVGQMFEISDKLAKKLDIIHYGKFSTNNQSAPESNVFFAGKIVTDDNETQSFIHLFTLIFE